MTDTITEGTRVGYTVMYSDGKGFGRAHIVHRTEYGRITRIWPPDAPAMCRIAVENPQPGRSRYVTRKIRDIAPARQETGDTGISRAEVQRVLDEVRALWAPGSPGTAKSQAEVAAIVISEIERDLAGIPGQDPGTWTVLGIWDNDEAVPIGAIAGKHDVHGEAPGDRLRNQLLGDPDFCGFDTSSFYEQGVWAVTVTAPDGDAAQDAAAREMMATLNHDEQQS